MAEPTPIEQPDPGAPIARDQIDPDLVKLARARPRIGIITAAGLVFLCIVFLLRLGPDRRFAGSSSEPTPAAVADVLAGKIDTDQLVVIAAEPLVSQAVRATNSRGSLGLRVVRDDAVLCDATRARRLGLACRSRLRSASTPAS